jgi:hypothetical protein
MRKGLIGIVLLCFFATTLRAAPLAVDVVSVRFNERRIAGQSYPWLEADISLRPTGKIYPEHISINLWLLYKEPTGKFVYKGTARLYAMQEDAQVRFYLPSDIIRIRRLPQTPSAYYLEISSSAGREPFEHSHTSPLLTTEAARNELKMSPAEPLLPHYFTPFYCDSETQRDMPAYEILQ